MEIEQAEVKQTQRTQKVVGVPGMVAPSSFLRPLQELPFHSPLLRSDLWLLSLLQTLAFPLQAEVVTIFPIF